MPSENITKAQEKQKKYYDSRHQPQIFSVGEKVLVENTAQKQRKGGKLHDKWLGPYKINREIHSGVYALETIDGKLLKSSCNTTRLKLFLEEAVSSRIPDEIPHTCSSSIDVEENSVTS